MDTFSATTDEVRRLAVLKEYGILDTPEEKVYDDVVKLISELLEAPIAAVNLIADGRQWFKAQIGLGTREMPLDNSICRFALLQEEQMVVPDTVQDARFSSNPLVTGDPGLRFYAGAVLRSHDGVPLGTLCVLDLAPRPAGLSERDRFILQTLAQQVMAHMELRKALKDQEAILNAQRITQEELRRERDQTQQLLEGMDEGFIFLDEEFRVRQINSGGLRLETRGADAILGLTHWEAWPGSEELPIAQRYKQAMRERVAATFEEYYRFPDGRSFWVDIRAYPANGGLAIFYRDISDRKAAEARLRATAERLEFTLQAAQIGEWDLDLERDTAFRSLRHDQCFGYTEPVEHWGVQSFIAHVHPDDREYVASQFEAALRDLADWNFECRVVWPDQSVHWIAAHGSIYGRGARPTRMSGIVYDITERKQAEEAVLRSQQHALVVADQAQSERRRLDALLEAAPVGIIVADASGALVQVNAENRRLWGAHPMSVDTGAYAEWKGWWADGSERHGMPLRPDEWAMARALRGEAAPRQIVEIVSFEEPPRRKTILNSGAAIRDAAGTITGALVAQMDITDRIKAEQALRQADQKKDEFLAMLAHELRNPLAPITSAAALLNSPAVTAATIRKAGEIIARQASHMTSLIDDLLDVSRVTQGKVKLDLAELNMRDVVADAIEQVRPLVERYGHRLGMQFAPGTSMVVGDRKRLVQVMTNLLSNAVRYTPHGGHIDIHLAAGPEHVTVVVRDNGIGMSEELIGKAFELFSQGTRELDRTQGGLGIGLALVKSLVQLHRGEVRVHSAGAGKGSTFEVTLPRTQHVAPAPPVEHDRQQGQVAPLRIGIVDDNEDAAMTLALLLQSAGHEVWTTGNAADALAHLPAWHADVCFLDIGLPGMNGFDLARALRADAATAPLVLIAVTGYAQEQDRRAAADAGFDDLFAKPVDFMRLQTALQAVSADRRARDPAPVA